MTGGQPRLGTLPALDVVTARELLHALDPSSLAHDAPWPAVAEQAARWRHKFLPTLLSVTPASEWESDPRLRLVGARQRAKDACHDDAAALLRAAVGDLAHEVRGSLLRRHYPDPVSRQQNDLDVAVPRGSIWEGARALVAQGWLVDGLMCQRVPADGADDATLVLTRSLTPGSDEDVARVEIATRNVQGDQWRRRPDHVPTATLTASARALLGLGIELTERRWGARDITDLVYLSTSLTEADVDAVRAAVGDLPQVRASLAEALSILGHAESWAAAGHQARELNRRPATALPGGSAPRRPLLALTLALAHDLRTRRRRGAATLLTGLQATVGARRLWEAGAPMFGVQVSERPTTGTSLAFHGPAGLLRTPVGAFVLSVGGDVPASWVRTAVRAEGA